MTMSKGVGPSNKECHCADADGDHRFSYDEAHTADKNTKRQAMMMIAGWAGRRCSGVGRIVPSNGRYALLVALTASLDLFICANDLFV